LQHQGTLADGIGRGEQVIASPVAGGYEGAQGPIIAPHLHHDRSALGGAGRGEAQAEDRRAPIEAEEHEGGEGLAPAVRVGCIPLEAVKADQHPTRRRISGAQVNTGVGDQRAGKEQDQRQQGQQRRRSRGLA